MKLELIIRGSGACGEGKSMHKSIREKANGSNESETAIPANMPNPDLGERGKHLRNPHTHSFHMPIRLTKKDRLVCWAH
jgi:hypothetical protein